MKQCAYRNRAPQIDFATAEYIRERVEAGEPQRLLAERFDVQPSEISQIVSRKRFSYDIELDRAGNKVQRLERELNDATCELLRLTRERKERKKELHRFIVEQ